MTPIRRDQYTRLDFNLMVAVCVLGKDATQDIHSPKALDDIVMKLHNILKMKSVGRYEAKRALDALAAKGMLDKVGDDYKRPAHVVSRYITAELVDPDLRGNVTVICELFYNHITARNLLGGLEVQWEWMADPTLTGENADPKYMAAITRIIDADFGDDVARAAGDVNAFRKVVKAFKRIEAKPATLAVASEGKYGVN